MADSFVLLSGRSLCRLSLAWPKNFIRAPPHPVQPDKLPLRLELGSTCGPIGNRQSDALVFDEPPHDESLFLRAREYGVENFALNNVPPNFFLALPIPIDLVEIELHVLLLGATGEGWQLAKLGA